jgi:predicted Rossmann fold nucleotide-binding protein DprA/Smf involved in DNA uptake
MNLAIIGSRTIAEINFENYIATMPTAVVSGAAVGIDTAAEQWAASKGIATKIFKPDYAKYGRIATFIRNQEIVKNCDALFAFWDGKSKGTLHAVNYAKKLGKEVKIFEV